jgi:hypothetical protein
LSAATENPDGWKWYEKAVAAILIVPLYLLAWPMLAFRIVFALSPGCTNLDCRPLDATLSVIPSPLLVIVTLLALALFVLSFISRPDTSSFLGAVIFSYRYACIFAPGVAGDEGFALPAPFLLGAIIDLMGMAPRALRLPLYCLVVIWLLILLGLLFLWMIKQFDKNARIAHLLRTLKDALLPTSHEVAGKVSSKPAPEDLSGVDKSLLGTCPNCGYPVKRSAEMCNHCNAHLGPTSAWKVKA